MNYKVIWIMTIGIFSNVAILLYWDALLIPNKTILQNVLNSKTARVATNPKIESIINKLVSWVSHLSDNDALLGL